MKPLPHLKHLHIKHGHSETKIKPLQQFKQTEKATADDADDDDCRLIKHLVIMHKPCLQSYSTGTEE